MKKFLALFVAVVVVFNFSVLAFAAPGSFVQSPSRNEAPQLIGGENESEDCEAKLVITPFKDRSTLSEKALNDIEAVYKILVNCKDLTSLNSSFAKFVESKGLLPVNLAVSDLFDISYYNCDEHDDHGTFRIKLSADTLKNFVGLLHYNNGKWEYVSNAKVLEDGETLQFNIKDLSPFAIVVSRDASSIDSPETGDMSYILPVVMCICSAALVVVCVNIKKRKVS